MLLDGSMDSESCWLVFLVTIGECSFGFLRVRHFQVILIYTRKPNKIIEFYGNYQETYENIRKR